jgi:hypothetical protein
VIYNARIPMRSSLVLIRSRIGKSALSVFPDPVGARISTFLPASTLGMAVFCIGVNSPNLSRTSSATLGIICTNLLFWNEGVKT